MDEELKRLVDKARQEPPTAGAVTQIGLRVGDPNDPLLASAKRETQELLQSDAETFLVLLMPVSGPNTGQVRPVINALGAQQIKPTPDSAPVTVPALRKFKSEASARRWVQILGNQQSRYLIVKVIGDFDPVSHIGVSRINMPIPEKDLPGILADFGLFSVPDIFYGARKEGPVAGWASKDMLWTFGEDVFVGITYRKLMENLRLL